MVDVKGSESPMNGGNSGKPSPRRDSSASGSSAFPAANQQNTTKDNSGSGNHRDEAKGATTDNATDEVVTIRDGPVERLTFWGYPKQLSVHDRKLLSHSRKGHKHRFLKNKIPLGTGGLYGTSLVVAKDGSGQVSSIFQAAEIANFDRNINTRFHIHVKAGYYYEAIEIRRPNVLLTGEGMDKTFIKGQNRAIEGKVSTSKSATFVVSGAGFMAKDITFENYAGPQAQQAVALRSSVDSFFYKCRFKGYQDTLYLQRGRQFYRDCEISGTIDFIFGDATAVLQNCHIIVRRPLNHHSNTITAQGRDKSTSTTGFVIQNSRITAETELRLARRAIKTYLGRPWGPFSRTVFMNCDIEDFVDAAGWRAWDNGKNSVIPDTTYYGEFNNRGIGANTRDRRRWKGYHLLTAGEAAQFSVNRFLQVQIPREIPVL